MRRIIPFMFLWLVLGACNSSTQPSAKYEEKKATLGDMERDSPQKFLKISGSSHGNLVNQTVVQGEIINKATLVTYKHITIRITFLDNEGAVIQKQKEVIDDEVKPGSIDDFKIKTEHVKGVNSVTLEIVDAVAEK